MKTRTRWSTVQVAVAVLCGFSSVLCGQEMTPCQAPEVVTYPEGRLPYLRYNELVCKGIASLSRGEYSSAVEAFEAAFRIRFHEDVNYQLYPRLALAYHLIGDRVRARQLLAEAALAIRLHVGLAQCRHDSAEGYIIVDKKGQGFVGPEHNNVRDRMCTPFTEGDYFEPRTIEEFAMKAELLILYLDVRQRVRE